MSGDQTMKKKQGSGPRYGLLGYPKKSRIFCGDLLDVLSPQRTFVIAETWLTLRIANYVVHKIHGGTL